MERRKGESLREEGGKGDSKCLREHALLLFPYDHFSRAVPWKK